MGAYLSAPITDKESITEKCNGFVYGASSMQGWRISQEDAHNCLPLFDDKTETSLFAVYDGHGGSEVAKYCSIHFPKFLKSELEKCEDESEMPTQVENSIKEAFLAFDATLVEDDVVKELKVLAGKDDDNDDEDEDDALGRAETDILKEEANMPLEQLLAQYKKPDDECTSGKSENPSDSCLSTDSFSEGSSGSGKVSISKQSSNTVVSCEASSSDSALSSHSNNNNLNCKDASREASSSSTNGSSSNSHSKDNDDTTTVSSSAGPGERSSKVKASTGLSALQFDSSDDDEDEDEDNEAAWEDLSEDDDEEEEEDNEDVPMMDMTNEEPGADSGCTACVVLFQKTRILVANVGDSRCVLSRADKAVELSFDHKPEDNPEKKRIEKAGGKVTADGRVNGGLNLSRAIGDHVYKRNTELPAKDQMITSLPDIMMSKLTDEDQFIVVACDGIWNYMSSQEVVDYVREKLKDPSKRENPSVICEEMFDHCLAPNTHGDGTGCDNMTCIIVLFDKYVKYLDENSRAAPSESQTSQTNHSNSSLKRTLESMMEGGNQDKKVRTDTTQLLSTESADMIH